MTASNSPFICDRCGSEWAAIESKPDPNNVALIVAVMECPACKHRGVRTIDRWAKKPTALKPDEGAQSGS